MMYRHNWSKKYLVNLAIRLTWYSMKRLAQIVSFLTDYMEALQRRATELSTPESEAWVDRYSRHPQPPLGGTGEAESKRD